MVKRLPALQIKGDLCVDALVGDFSAIHFSSKFLDVNRADIPQGFRPLAYRALCGILPAPGDVARAHLATLHSEAFRFTA